MFCEKCGAQLPEGATFCEKCGNKTETDNNTAPAPNKDRVNNTKKQLGFIAAAVIAIVAAVLFILGHKTTVDLNNYLKAEFDGYNTVGKATISFDSDAFNEKYKNKFRRVTNSKIEDPAFIVVSYMKNSEKHEEDLSNGDVIEYKWDIEADKIEKEMGCKIKYSDTSFTVEGLKEVEVLDPFKYLEVEFKGTAPKGRLDYKNNSGKDKAYSYLRIVPDKTNGLSNDDEVVFTAENLDDVNRQTAEELGQIFEGETKSFKVEGLAHYVQKTDELSDDATDAMIEQAKDVITAYTATRWSIEKLDSIEPVGIYLLTAKDVESYNRLGENSVYVLCKVEEHIGETPETAAKRTFYYPVRYDKILIDGEGECIPDTGKYKTPTDGFDFEEEINGQKQRFYNFGYQTVDEFIEKSIKAYADAYTYDKKDLTQETAAEDQTEETTGVSDEETTEETTAEAESAAETETAK